MWWLILAMVSASDGFLFSEPKFESEVECLLFVDQHALDLNSYVNEKYNYSMQKVNPLVCISEKDWNEIKDESEGRKT